MNNNINTIARRLAVAVAGSAIATGLFAGAVAVGAPANAEPQGMKCFTAEVVATPPGATSLLTRPGQIDAASGFVPQNVSAKSCFGH